MVSNASGVRVSVQVATGGEQREVLTATKALERELSRLGRVESAGPAMPHDSKGIGEVDPSSFVLTGVLTASLLRSLVRVVTAFIARGGAKEIELECSNGEKVVIHGVVSAPERALVKDWIERTASSGLKDSDKD